MGPIPGFSVQAGDTISGIAASHYGSSDKLLQIQLAKYNGVSNANDIYAGQPLLTPDIDTLRSISVSEADITAYNARADQIEINAMNKASN